MTTTPPPARTAAAAAGRRADSARRRGRVIAAWASATAGNLADLQPRPTPNGRPSARRLTELLTQPPRVCWKLPTLPVWHCSIHNHPKDPILTDHQWEHIATEIAAAVGLRCPEPSGQRPH